MINYLQRQNGFNYKLYTMFRRIKLSWAFSSYHQGKNYYQILGVQQSASAQEIKNAYRSLAKKYHPDMNKGNEDKFKDINQAYQVLSDPKAKQQYDYSQPQPQSQYNNPYNNTRYTQQSSYRNHEWENMHPRDRQIFEMLRKQQEQFQREYREFQRERQRRGSFHYRRYAPQEQQLRRYYQQMKNGKYQYSERRSRNSQYHREEYNEKYDRSQDSLLGFLGQAAKGAWQFWMDLKSKK